MQAELVETLKEVKIERIKNKEFKLWKVTGERQATDDVRKAF